MNRKPFLWITIALVALCEFGCTDTLSKGYSIDKTRVLGARVELTSDPSVASPAPGDTAHVDWIIAEPAEPAPLAWAFVACAPSPTRNGDAICTGAPFGLSAGMDRPPRLDLTVPDAATLAGATSILVFGAVCANGTLDVAGASPMMPPHCAGTAPEQINVTLSVALAPMDGPNHNPMLAEDRVFVGDASWPPPADIVSLPFTGCADSPADPTLPHVALGSPAQSIRVSIDDADRETFLTMQGSPPAPVTVRETLQLSQFVTLGKLSGQFSIVEANDTRSSPDVHFEWTPPTDATKVDTHGTLVRFWLVLRDSRGGLVSTERTACVTR